LLLLILGYAAFLRLHQFTTLPPGQFHDEAMNGCNVLEVLETHQFKAFYPENNGREGLYINIATVFVRLFGNLPWALRLPAALFGILTVWAVYLLGAELFSKSCGLLSAFFVATSFWHIMFSRLGLRAVAAPCFLAFALYFLLRGMSRFRDGKSWLGMLVLAGFVYGLGFYTYLSYRATPLLIAPLIGLYLLRSHQKQRGAAALKGSAAFVLTAALVVVPLALSSLQVPSFNQRISQLSVSNAPHPSLRVAANLLRTAALIFVRGEGDLRGNVPHRPNVFWPVAILFAAGAVAVSYTLYRRLVYRLSSRDSLPFAIALGWLIVAALPAILSAPNSLRLILVIPPVFLLAGWAGIQAYLFLLSREMQFRAVPALLLLAFLAVCCYEPYRTYFQVWGKDPRVAALTRDLMNVSRAIQSLPREDPKYVVSSVPGPAENGVPSALLSVAYLTRSYTKRGQQDADIFYIGNPGGSPDSFCEHVKAGLRGKAVFCVSIPGGFGP
jgi:4-amino-4-deoxy-L-arabinose transferase-like glycosyltransferase